MAPKEDYYQFRCSTETKARFKSMLEDIDPLGDKEDSVKRILDRYEENPDFFRVDYR